MRFEMSHPAPTSASDHLRHALNDRVLRELSSASLALCGAASGCDDAEQARRLLGCVDRLDDTVTEIRAILVDLERRRSVSAQEN